MVGPFQVTGAQGTQPATIVLCVAVPFFQLPEIHNTLRAPATMNPMSTPSSNELISPTC